MSFSQVLDLDFQLLGEDFLEGYENGNDDAGRFNVDDIFEPVPKNPVFGNDLSLASALNLNSDDDLLACAPTDTSPFEVEVVQQVAKKQSPWHESDSGMSDTTTTPSSSPHRLDQDNVPDSHSVSQQTLTLANMDELNVNIEDLDFDIDQCSSSSSYTASPPYTHIYQDPQLSATKSTDDDFITVVDAQQKQAFEFFESYSNQPKKLKLVKVQQVDVPEDKSRKNAIQAKINREKKKAYINTLEEETKSLKCDNTKLKSENQKMKSSISELEEEVEYLKSVLVNSSSLSGLLKNISNVPEVKLSATVAGRKRSVADDHSYDFDSAPVKRARRIQENLKKAGVIWVALLARPICLVSGVAVGAEETLVFIRSSASPVSQRLHTSRSFCLLMSAKRCNFWLIGTDYETLAKCLDSATSAISILNVIGACFFLCHDSRLI